MDITRKSLLSGVTRTRTLDITPEQWAAFEGGAHIQNALGHLSDSDREFILTGSTDEEWDAEFGEDDEDEGYDWLRSPRSSCRATRSTRPGSPSTWPPARSRC